MKILVVNTFDVQGGAARAAHRLHNALLTEGVDSHMLVQHKVSDGPAVTGPSSRLEKCKSIVRPTLDALALSRYRNCSKTNFSPAWLPFSSMVSRINSIKPDIVHLHWIAGGMMRIEDISRIEAPVVWSLHDMWPFTGGCHYDNDCGEFKNECGDCPVLHSGRKADLSQKVFRRKALTYQKKKDITVVGLSQWIAEEARASRLFSDSTVINLPNPIDRKVFSPFDKQQARKLLGLPEDKKLVVFGAVKATRDPRKGFENIIQALQKIHAQDVELVVFGASQPGHDSGFSHPVHYLGHLQDDVSLRALYASSDVVLVPSLQENLSNTIMEALACGRPTVAFGIGGNSDMIDHKRNGYLAKPFDVEDLAQGIDWVLNYDEPETLAKHASSKVTANFDSGIVAGAYIKLYESILANRN